MRWILLAVLLVGCSDGTPAGSNQPPIIPYQVCVIGAVHSTATLTLAGQGAAWPCQAWLDVRRNGDAPYFRISQTVASTPPSDPPPTRCHFVEDGGLVDYAVRTPTSTLDAVAQHWCAWLKGWEEGRGQAPN